MNKFTYRTIHGQDIEKEFDGDYVLLRRQHNGSCTPITSINGVPEDLTQFLVTLNTHCDSEIERLQTEIKGIRKQKANIKKEMKRRSKAFTKGSL